MKWNKKRIFFLDFKSIARETNEKSYLKSFHFIIQWNVFILSFESRKKHTLPFDVDTHSVFLTKHSTENSRNNSKFIWILLSNICIRFFSQIGILSRNIKRTARIVYSTKSSLSNGIFSSSNTEYKNSYYKCDGSCKYLGCRRCYVQQNVLQNATTFSCLTATIFQWHIKFQPSGFQIIELFNAYQIYYCEEKEKAGDLISMHSFLSVVFAFVVALPFAY